MTSIAVSTAISSGRGELVNVRQRTLLMAKWRVLWVVAGFGAIALIALLRIAWLGLFEESPTRVDGLAALVPERGDIVDRNGVPLARAFPAYALWYNPAALGGDGPPLVHGPRWVAEALARIFPDLNADELTRRLADGRPGYLRRRILPEDANRIHALGEPALEFPREIERFYPQGSMAAHVLGFVGADGRGHVGMEQVFDKRLTDPATRAAPAELSLDTRVQGALEDELARGMLDSAAKGAAGIVLDVDTGEVVALASLPSFNPNLIDRAGEANIFNRVTNQVYELGSVIKPITIAAAIDAGVVTDLSRRYQSNHPLQIGGFQIHDSHNFGASLNVPEALIHSSNIVTAQVADQLGSARLNATMRALDMNQRPGIELPARGFPLWPDGQWSRITTMTVSYGHGIAVTPLHLASSYAALVNGGIWRPATLLKVEPGHAVAGRRVWKASTSARMRQLLRLIVDLGTGRKANAAGYRVGGKTGSAEKPGAGGYRRNSVVATFAAAFPMDRPRYVVIAMLDEPQGTVATSGQRTAAWNAAPIVGRVVPRIGPLLGIMPDATRDVDITDLAPLVGSGEGE
ncbi:MAG: penicillin-binding protein 2 [Sphingomonadales bacterium]|nr:penicillin-binding protein 2 [Sphingomonadales bacterium]